MLAKATIDIEVARGVHVGAQVRVPNDARGVVAIVNDHAALAESCNDRGFATVAFGLTADSQRVEHLAALFADAIAAARNEGPLRDRPVGYYGEDIGGVAALIAASLHGNDVAAVVTHNAPLELVGTRLSDVRAPALHLANEADDADQAVAWFDHYLRGVMRGARRDLWRSA